MFKRRQGRGEVVRVGSLFDAYKTRLRAPQGSVVKTFQEVVKDLFGVEVRSDQCSYSVHTKTLTVHAQGPLKSEIRLRKAEILTHMKGRIGEKGTPIEIL